MLHRPNSAFHPSSLGPWVVIHVITPFKSIVGWRPLNGIAGLHMAVWLQVKVCWCGIGPWPIDCMHALSVTQAPLQL